MNNKFSAQYTDESPRVLILGGDNQLSLIINHIFTSSGFVSKFFNLDNVDEEEIKNFFFINQLVYKTVWVDLGDGVDNKNKLTVTELLQNRPEPLIYFTQYSQIKNTTNLTDKNNIKSSGLKAGDFAQKTVLIQDLVSADELFLPWTKIFSEFRKKLLLDPGVVLYPITTEGVKKELEKILFSPGGNEIILIRGKGIKSKELLVQIVDFFEKTSGIELKIKEASYIPHEKEALSFNSLIELITPNNEILSFLLQAAKKTAKKNLVVLKKSIPVVSPSSKIKQFSPPPLVKIEEKQEPFGRQEIEKEIESIFNQDRVLKKTKKIVKKINKTKLINEKQKRRKTVFFLGLFVFGVLMGTISLSGIFLLSNKIQNKYLSSEIEKLSIDSSPQASEEFSLGLEKSSFFVSVQYSAYSSFLPKQWLSLADKNLSLFRYLKQYKQLKTKSQENSQELISFIFSQKPNSAEKSFDKLITKHRMGLDELSAFLSIAQLELKTKFAPNDLYYEKLEQLIIAQKKQLQISTQLLDALPDLLLNNGQRNYLVLLENNMEIRPGGGVIESVALLSFESGHLKNYQVYDVSELEKNIKGDWEAPVDFQQIFGQKNIQAQDSSWFLDFTDSSEEITKQFESVFGKKIDGVLAVNLISIESILRIIGPLDLTSYNEQISSENIVEKLYLRASTDLNTKLGKESYFTSLFGVLLSDLFKESESQQFLKTFSQLAKEKQFFINTKNSDFFDKLNWSGKILQPQCPPPFDQSCQVDSIFQTETNISANYSNYAVHRSIHHSIVLDRGFAQHSRLLSFENLSPSVSWPGGTYKSYLRFSVNKDSELESIEFAGKKISNDQIIISSEGDKKTWGVIIELAPLDKKDLLIKYKVPLKNQLSYGFFDQKQAGMGSDPLMVEVSYSPTLSPSIIAPQAEVLANKLRFSLLRDSDSSIMIQFK